LRGARVRARPLRLGRAQRTCCEALAPVMFLSDMENPQLIARNGFGTVRVRVLCLHDESPSTRIVGGGEKRLYLGSEISIPKRSEARRDRSSIDPVPLPRSTWSLYTRMAPNVSMPTVKSGTEMHSASVADQMVYIVQYQQCGQRWESSPSPSPSSMLVSLADITWLCVVSCRIQSTRTICRWWRLRIVSGGVQLGPRVESQLFLQYVHLNHTRWRGRYHLFVP
jgi:hypothetical protein